MSRWCYLPVSHLLKFGTVKAFLYLYRRKRMILVQHELLVNWSKAVHQCKHPAQASSKCSEASRRHSVTMFIVKCFFSSSLIYTLGGWQMSFGFHVVLLNFTQHLFEPVGDIRLNKDALKFFFFHVMASSSYILSTGNTISLPRIQHIL